VKSHHFVPTSSNFMRQQFNVIVFYLPMLDIATFVMARHVLFPYTTKMEGVLLPCTLCPSKFHPIQVDNVLLGSKLLELH
jgi:hypothetical protein